MVLIACVAMIALAGCGSSSSSSSEEVKNDDQTFVVGLDDSFPPMGFRDDNNNIVGFDVDLAKEAGKRMGHAGALISGGADTADAKLAIMEECGFKVTRNPSEMAKLLKAML